MPSDRAIDLTAGEHVELRRCGVEVGDVLLPEPGKGEVGIGNRHALAAGAVGDVGEMIDRDVVVAGVGVGVVAACGFEFVEVHRADFLGAQGGAFSAKLNAQ